MNSTTRPFTRLARAKPPLSLSSASWVSWVRNSAALVQSLASSCARRKAGCAVSASLPSALRTNSFTGRVPTASAISSTAEATAGTVMADLGVTDTLESVGSELNRNDASGSVSVTGLAGGSALVTAGAKMPARRSRKGMRSMWYPDTTWIYAYENEMGIPCGIILPRNQRSCWETLIALFVGKVPLALDGDSSATTSGRRCREYLRSAARFRRINRPFEATEAILLRLWMVASIASLQGAPYQLQTPSLEIRAGLSANLQCVLQIQRHPDYGDGTGESWPAAIRNRRSTAYRRIQHPRMDLEQIWRLFWSSAF